jgi:hypothetical protein
VAVIPKAELARFCSLGQHFRYINRTFQQLRLGEDGKA